MYMYICKPAVTLGSDFYPAVIPIGVRASLNTLSFKIELGIRA